MLLMLNLPSHNFRLSTSRDPLHTNHKRDGRRRSRGQCRLRIDCGVDSGDAAKNDRAHNEDNSQNYMRFHNNALLQKLLQRRPWPAVQKSLLLN
jgi:hypothetical protein